MTPEPVKLWYVLEQEGVAAVARDARLSSVLSPLERERAGRFRFPEDRDRFITGRVLARLMLAGTGGTPPEAWDLAIDARGRPRVTGYPPGEAPAFSITHTQGLVACALIPTGEVGVDAEHLGKRHDEEAIAGRFFAPDEVAGLQAVAGEERRRRFYVLWTLKEAFLKARGDGITVPLDRFAFDPSSAPPGFACDETFEASPSAWRFRSWWPTPGHAMALALRVTPPADPEVRERRVSADVLSDLP